MSVRKAIRLAQFSHGGWYCKSQARDQSALRLRIREIAHARPRFGYLRIHVMLRREGWPVNKKRVYRWYRLEGLQIRMRVRRRKHMCLHRGPVPQAQRTHERWSADFVHDQCVPHAICFPLMKNNVLQKLGMEFVDRSRAKCRQRNADSHPFLCRQVPRKLAQRHCIRETRWKLRDL